MPQQELGAAVEELKIALLADLGASLDERIAKILDERGFTLQPSIPEILSPEDQAEHEAWKQEQRAEMRRRMVETAEDAVSVLKPLLDDQRRDNRNRAVATIAAHLHSSVSDVKAAVKLARAIVDEAERTEK